MEDDIASAEFNKSGSEVAPEFVEWCNTAYGRSGVTPANEMKCKWESCGVALTIGQNITKTILLSPKQALILVIFASPLPWVPAHGPNKNHVNDTKNDYGGRETHTQTMLVVTHLAFSTPVLHTFNGVL